MRRWTKINIGLAVLAAMLAALLWLPGADDEIDRLTDLDPASIATLRIERGNALTLALERHGESWQMSFPEPRAVESRRVNTLLAIARARAVECFNADGDKAQFGLAPPQAVLQLDDARLAFGKRDTSQRLRYVDNGGEVCVVDDVYFNLLTLPARHFTAD